MQIAVTEWSVRLRTLSRTLLRVAVPAALLALPRHPASAQPATAASTCTGDGTGFVSLGPAVKADYVREHGPGCDRLAAVVLWRGQPGWPSIPFWEPLLFGMRRRAVERRFHAVRDSLARPTAGARALSGGLDARRFWGVATTQPRARPMQHLDIMVGDAGRVVPLGRYRLAGADSVLVVLVDRTDGVGGAPVVTATAWLPPASTVGLGTSPEERARLLRGEDPGPSTTAATLRRLLAPVPAARAFLRE